MSQIDQVKKILRENKSISRNYCIRELYITRLSAHIKELIERGWDIKGEYRNGDYIYTLNTSRDAKNGSLSDKNTSWREKLHKEKEDAKIAKMPRDKKGKIIAC